MIEMMINKNIYIIINNNNMMHGAGPIILYLLD